MSTETTANQSPGQRFENRVAIVTGGSSGFGEAVARQLLAEGARVEIFDIVAPRIDEDRLGWTKVDVGRNDDWRVAIKHILAKHGRLDILVNNAGVIAYPAAHEIDVETWDRVVSINQTGVMLGLRHVLPSMLDRGSGVIVNVSSTLGVVAVPGAVAYHATKGAVTQMTRNAAVTYATRGIRVNEVQPGIGDTPMARRQAAEITEEAIARAPMRRLALPSEVAAAILFLASDDASFITGVSLPVDGGYLAQ